MPAKKKITFAESVFADTTPTVASKRAKIAHPASPASQGDSSTRSGEKGDRVLPVRSHIRSRPDLLEEEEVELHSPEPMRSDPLPLSIYREDAPKVILVSSDGQRFCVDKNTLSTYSTFFRDMFSHSSGHTSRNDLSAYKVIEIEESSEILSMFIGSLYADQIQRYSRTPTSTAKLPHIHAILKLYNNFDIREEIQQQAETELNEVLRKDPFEGFAYASQQNDVELGRKAIRLMKLSSVSRNFDFWGAISKAEESWQLELARSVMPTSTEICTTGNRNVKVNVIADTMVVAREFNPK